MTTLGASSSALSAPMRAASLVFTEPGLKLGLFFDGYGVVPAMLLRRVRMLSVSDPALVGLNDTTLMGAQAERNGFGACGRGEARTSPAPKAARNAPPTLGSQARRSPAGDRRAASGTHGPGAYRSARAELLSAKTAIPCYTAQVRRLDAPWRTPPFPYELRGPNHRAHGDHESSQRLTAVDR